MAKIVVSKDAFILSNMELEPGTTSIGRNSDNDLHLDDTTVSGKHAKIVILFDSFYVEDLGSTNGTYVNGNKVKTHTLRNGDVLTIGNFRILFEAPQESNPESENAPTHLMDQAQIANVIAAKAMKESANTTKESSAITGGETDFDKSARADESFKNTISQISTYSQKRSRPASNGPAFNSSPAKSYPQSRKSETGSVRAATKRKTADDEPNAGIAPDRNRRLGKSNRSSPSREIIVVSILAIGIIAAIVYALFV